MKKLTPEQAQWLVKVIADYFPAYTLCPSECSGVDYLLEAIDELTAKPGDEEFCEGCKHYHHHVRSWFRDHAKRKRIECAHPDELHVLHPDFTPGVCPIGRWEEK